MDDATSENEDTYLEKSLSYLLKVEDPACLKPPYKQNNTIIKYTKIPQDDFELNLPWSTGKNFAPRFRRLVLLEEDDIITNRSLPHDIVVPSKKLNNSQRKVVTMTDNDDNDLHPRFSSRNTNITLKNSGRSSIRTLNKATGRDMSAKTTRTNFSCESGYTKESKLKTKPVTLSGGKYNGHIESSRNQYSNNKLNSEKMLKKNMSASKNQNFKEFKRNDCSDSVTLKSSIPFNTKCETKSKSSRNTFLSNRSSLNQKNKPLVKNEKEIDIIKNKYLEDTQCSNVSPKNIEKKTKTKGPFCNSTKTNKDLLVKGKPTFQQRKTNVIHVPFDKNVKSSLEVVNKIDCSTEVSMMANCHDVQVGTDPLPQKKDVTTEIEHTMLHHNIEMVDTLDVAKVFDNLDVPNITLTKEKSEISKEKIVNLLSKSEPNLQVSTVKSISDVERNNKSTSFIIGHATFTYTTRQKINIQVVENKEVKESNKEPSNVSSRLAYPINIVSVLKRELNIEDVPPSMAMGRQIKDCYTNYLTEMQSLNCAYVLNNRKLIKPSDIVNTMAISNELFENDYISEQFQREINFIDSFVDSLQFLENCSLSDKYFSDVKVENLVSTSALDVQNTEYGSFLAKLEDRANDDNTQIMASKSLYLLNFLIRDEQRRAKNLLFVLKMREEALKHFTKSQILWLENKKKQVNTDISSLKKKQRGALVKLQHECGEMQRMRKALLALSEKRKAALISTKKNIELKLKNNVEVDFGMLEKKKLKRNSLDRNIAPLKCFDLSSSCDEAPPKIKIDCIPSEHAITHEEKSVQTGDSICNTVSVDVATDIAEEYCVTVDGSYLNILFKNMSMPQIFSGGKQYEVNEDALRSILHKANRENNRLSDFTVHRFMEHIKCPDQDTSSSPSTARSLVEEMNQYYMEAVEEENANNSQSCQLQLEEEAKDSVVQEESMHRDISAEPLDVINTEMECNEQVNLWVPEESVISNDTVNVEVQEIRDETEIKENNDICLEDPTIEPESLNPILSVTKEENLECNVKDTEQIPESEPISLNENRSTITPGEAEELRRQQLEIEREIKALEQQQCQLLVVREIPDKPPPPYTPPTEQRLQKQTKPFAADETIGFKIEKYFDDKDIWSFAEDDPLDAFISDFCKETLERQQAEKSDKPWDGSNLLPSIGEEKQDKIVERTKLEIDEILNGAPRAVAGGTYTGVTSRRSDHIDDILFAEWRRCETEWTSLHEDEATVKNMVFESIFQRVLSETIDQYKQTVLGDALVQK